MKMWRRLAISTAAAAIAVTAPAPAGWSQSPPASPAKTTPPPAAHAAAPAGGRLPPRTVVHSWALTPSGEDPDQPGSRTSLSYDASPGAEIQDKVALFNYSNVMLTFRVYATDAFNNADGDFDLLPGAKKPTDVGGWVTLPQPYITLPPRSQATMPITVKVPADARPGDHAGAVLASSEAQGTGPDRKIVTLDRRTGSRVYVRVSGPLSPELVVARVKTSYEPSLNPLSGHADVTYRVENRGNVRLGGTQQVSIAAPFGIARKQKPSAKLPELLPGQGLTLHASFEGVAATGLTVARVYLAVTPVAKDVGVVPARSSRATTVAFPFSVLALLLGTWLLVRARRSYLRHQAEQAGSGAGA